MWRAAESVGNHAALNLAGLAKFLTCIKADAGSLLFPVVEPRCSRYVAHWSVSTLLM